MLSAKLAEGKIRIVDTEKLESPKTKNVAQILRQYQEKTKILLVTSYKSDGNFKIAQKNISRMDIAYPDVSYIIYQSIYLTAF